MMRKLKCRWPFGLSHSVRTKRIQPCVLDPRSERNLAGVKTELAKVARRAFQISTVPFTVIQGVRTQLEQDALYAQGRSRPGRVVTWTRKSKHVAGKAIDFAALLEGRIVWVPTELYRLIVTAFRQAASELATDIAWGGDWSPPDWGHVELTEGTNAQWPVPFQTDRWHYRPSQSKGATEHILSAADASAPKP